MVGPYPPPYGGISVHVQRMEALLREHGHTPVVFSQGSAKKWIVSHWRDRSSFDVVHFHDISWGNRVLIGLLGFLGFKVVLTIHGDSLKNQLDSGNWLRKWLLRFAMRHITHIVCVKDDIRVLLLSLGVKPSRISVINAYLPPSLSLEVAVPQTIQDFARSHTPLIVANGFEVIPLSKDTDLYGINLTLDLCARLIKDYPQTGCLFFLARIGNQEQYETLAAKISQLGLDHCFRFVIGENLTPVLSLASLFVRPTYQDGYGISVTEALHFGVPALASDVCEREKGAILFRCGDYDDFYRRTRQILDDYDTVKQTVQQLKPEGAYELLMVVYRHVWSGDSH